MQGTIESARDRLSIRGDTFSSGPVSGRWIGSLIRQANPLSHTTSPRCCCCSPSSPVATPPAGGARTLRPRIFLTTWGRSAIIKMRFLTLACQVRRASTFSLEDGRVQPARRRIGRDPGPDEIWQAQRTENGDSRYSRPKRTISVPIGPVLPYPHPMERRYTPGSNDDCPQASMKSVAA